ncbi:pyridoxal phosphate-dependent aminotransferase family protein [uncultured Thermanaerothrix sp.]|uniref:aminotransferase class I/II-fold pyridoxal phosphate-dependent enzyme n=1 Tax=uncultured Thermanaerothrix sp. TaxID=1195149 RepID=UPI002616D3D9|nr:pyridoxal phosphate-dependent aminotransferase family protein [uncultured Thermanaerothrix sp.]
MTEGLSSPVGPRVRVAGRECDYFSGTGYLGLQSDPRVLAAAQAALTRFGLSTATSRGGYGEHPLYADLEQAICTYFGTEQALYLPTGYLGMALLVQGLHGHYERLFVDEAAHFSVWDAARGANLPIVSFRHLDAEDLARQLRTHLRPGERPLVLSDGVFPISGDIAPLPEYLRIVAEYDGLVALDDAHGVGVLGAHGRGTPDYWGVSDVRCFSTATLSKALGGYGGIVTDQAERIQRLLVHSAVYVATSPPPLPVAAASAMALRIALEEPQRRERLWQNVGLARAGLRALGWDLPETPVPILCLRAQPGLDLGVLQRRLLEADICVAHVTRYSSTPPGGALRIAIFATHTEAQIQRLVETLGRLL